MNTWTDGAIHELQALATQLEGRIEVLQVQEPGDSIEMERITARLTAFQDIRGEILATLQGLEGKH